MKNNFFFLILFLLLGCTSKTTFTVIKIPCPNVLFASEHKKYITNNTQSASIENISYRADINNYSFNTGCSLINELFEAKLSLLFIVKPEKAQVSDIILPFYVAVLNADDELVEIQYYQTNGNLKYEPEDENYIETELIKTIKLQIPFLNDQNYSRNKVIVGFMIDKKKIKILN